MSTTAHYREIIESRFGGTWASSKYGAYNGFAQQGALRDGYEGRSFDPVWAWRSPHPTRTR